MNASGVERICKWIAAGLVAAVAFGVTGCGKKEEQSASTNKAASVQRVVKIGHAAPLTGGIAHLGKDNENGVRLAVEEINAQGLTIDGHKIDLQLDAQDDAADPKTGTAVAQKL